MFTRVRTAHLDGRFFMQTIRIIPSIPYQPFLFQNCGLKNAPLYLFAMLTHALEGEQAKREVKVDKK